MSAQHQQTVETLARAAGFSVPEFEARCLALHRATQNGAAVAAVIFARAGDYWTDFFDLEDRDALAIWADVFGTYEPFVTPAIAEQAVDAVHAAGVTEPALAHFIQAARNIMEDTEHGA